MNTTAELLESTPEQVYLEYYNNWLTVPRMAEHFEINEDILMCIINEGRKTNNEPSNSDGYLFLVHSAILSGNPQGTVLFNRLSESSKERLFLHAHNHDTDFSNMDNWDMDTPPTFEESKLNIYTLLIK